MIFILALFCLTATTLSARGLDFNNANNVAFMISIPLIGSATFTEFGYTSNCGNVFFSVVLFGLALKHQIYGLTEARRSLNSTIGALATVYTLIVILDYLTPSMQFVYTPRKMCASFMSFWLAQGMLFWSLNRFRRFSPLWTVPAIIIVLQTMTTFLFFIGGYTGIISNTKLIEFIIVGVAVKAMVAIMAIPFLAYALWAFKTSNRDSPSRRRS